MKGKTMFEENKRRYKPKRQVNNKKSNKKPHLIGGFYSNKMDWIVNFESSRETIIGKIAELSPKIREYYVQPLRVRVKVYNSVGELIWWPHIPDNLIFPYEHSTCLYEIKADREDTKIADNTIRACIDYAKKRGWEYRIIYPFELDKTLRSNIDFIFAFRNKDCSNESISESLRLTLQEKGEMSISSLSRILEPETSRLSVLPVIYHEVAKGEFYIDMLKTRNPESLIRIRKKTDKDLYDYVLELDSEVKIWR